MLFFLNKTGKLNVDLIGMISGGEESSLLLVGDAVTLGTPTGQELLSDFEFEDVFVHRDAVEARNISLSERCVPVTYSDMVDILMNHDGQIVSL
ncbi:hypothetical protein DND132_0966 [Pseudodesulfovibrio mercurii]|uniref:Sulfurtransferase complex subunit TusB n=1 Tax=Pseudodesulfovibrio mercurii TaxID=641491 RepID=F0JIC7_9BACT|nr:DsrH/TusB family sulfur metabolism protein [Pseudodesulfovibrio mercurii]EGB14179.1 hypothetical protein DND132_0966 [Pseudodesulfovibrio mercurii]